MRFSLSARFRILAAVLAILAVAAGCGGASATASAAATSPGGPAATSPTATPTPSPTPSPTPEPSPTPPVPPFRHVYVIIDENKVYASVIGSNHASYINSLAARYGLATAFYAEAHPSQPNYIALFSGGTQGVTSDGTYNLAVPSLFDQLDSAGKTWHVYAQAYPGHCYTGSSYGPATDGPGFAGWYARKHNPAISFTSIRRDPSRCAQITGLKSFDPAAADFELIIPNQYNDMHSTPPTGNAVRAGDEFLKAFLPSILGSPAFEDSVVFITWDEGNAVDQHIPTLVISPGMTPGYRSAEHYTHYSMLRTIEEAWGLPYLGQAASAAPMLFPY
jgi:hypothetical protein